VGLFILYTADLADNIDKHDVDFHAYDSQLYIHCDRSNTASAAAPLEHCITDIGHWMSANRLKLNAEKTELLWTGTKHSLSLLGGCGPCLRLGEDIIAASKHVRVLGVTISSDLSLVKHVSNVQRDFSRFDNFVASDDHLTPPSRLRHSSMLSCRPAWITVMQSTLGRRRI